MMRKILFLSALAVMLSLNAAETNVPDASNPVTIGVNIVGGESEGSEIREVIFVGEDVLYTKRHNGPGGTTSWFKTDDSSAAYVWYDANTTEDVKTGVIYATSTGEMTLDAIVKLGSTETEDSVQIDVIDVDVDGYVYGSSSSKIDGLEGYTAANPANIIASGHLEIEAALTDDDYEDDFYYSWSVNAGAIIGDFEGQGSDFLTIDFEAPSDHEKAILVTLKIYDDETSDLYKTVKCHLKSIRPYAYKVKFVDDFWDEEQQIHPLAEESPEWERDGAVNHPVCYVMDRGMEVVVDFAGSKTNDGINDLAKSTQVGVEYVATYGGQTNSSDKKYFDALDWSTADEMDLETDDNLPEKIYNHSDLSLNWNFYVKNTAGEWVLSYEDNVPYSQKTEHDLYTTLDVQEFDDQSFFFIDVIQHAVNYTSGKKTDGPARLDLLKNGFDVDYIYGDRGNCGCLSRDFVNMCKALGVDASENRWGNPGAGVIGYSYSVGEMFSMYPKDFTPVNSTWAAYRAEFDPYGWIYHQWAESGGNQYDPSVSYAANPDVAFHSGGWGVHEDKVMKKYSRVDTVDASGNVVLPVSWHLNQTGTSFSPEDTGIHSVPTLSKFKGPPYAR